MKSLNLKLLNKNIKSSTFPTQKFETFFYPKPIFFLSFSKFNFLYPSLSKNEISHLGRIPLTFLFILLLSTIPVSERSPNRLEFFSLTTSIYLLIILSTQLILNIFLKYYILKTFLIVLVSQSYMSLHVHFPLSKLLDK